MEYWSIGVMEYWKKPLPRLVGYPNRLSDIILSGQLFVHSRRASRQIVKAS